MGAVNEGKSISPPAFVGWGLSTFFSCLHFIRMHRPRATNKVVYDLFTFMEKMMTGMMRNMVNEARVLKKGPLLAFASFAFFPLFPSLSFQPNHSVTTTPPPPFTTFLLHYHRPHVGLSFSTPTSWRQGQDTPCDDRRCWLGWSVPRHPP